MSAESRARRELEIMVSLFPRIEKEAQAKYTVFFRDPSNENWMEFTAAQYEMFCTMDKIDLLNRILRDDSE